MTLQLKYGHQEERLVQGRSRELDLIQRVEFERPYRDIKKDFGSVSVELRRKARITGTFFKHDEMRAPYVAHDVVPAV